MKRGAHSRQGAASGEVCRGEKEEEEEEAAERLSGGGRERRGSQSQARVVREGGVGGAWDF